MISVLAPLLLISVTMAVIDGLRRRPRQRVCCHPGRMLMMLVPALAAATIVLVASTWRLAPRPWEAEARASLRTLWNAEQVWFAQHGTYTGDLDELGFRIHPSYRYAYGCGGSALPSARGTLGAHDPGDGAEWPTPLAPVARATTFRCMAVANLDGDDFLDVWAVDESGAITRISDDRADRVLEVLHAGL